MSEVTFKSAVLKNISLIPLGKVVSYGQVASSVGSPRSARAVGWVLRTLDAHTDVPWWRVINSKGIVSIKANWKVSKITQKNMLESEGVVVDKNFQIDLKKYQYHFGVV